MDDIPMGPGGQYRSVCGSYHEHTHYVSAWMVSRPLINIWNMILTLHKGNGCFMSLLL